MQLTSPLRTMDLLTRHGSSASSGVAAASVDRHNCDDEVAAPVCTTTTRSRWPDDHSSSRPKRGRRQRPLPLVPGLPPRHDLPDIDGFEVEVVIGVAAVGGIPPVVAAVAAALYRGSLASASQIHLSSFSYFSRSLQKKKQGRQRNFQQKHRSGSMADGFNTSIKIFHPIEATRTISFNNKHILCVNKVSRG